MLELCVTPLVAASDWRKSLSASCAGHFETSFRPTSRSAGSTTATQNTSCSTLIRIIMSRVFHGNGKKLLRPIFMKIDSSIDLDELNNISKIQTGMFPEKKVMALRKIAKI